MPPDLFVKKYSLTASLTFLAGLVSCMTGLLFAMVSRLSRSSGSDVILVVCLFLGAGILLILTGINVAGLHKRFSRSYSLIAGILLSVCGLLVFMISFPDNWLYPRVSYVIVAYSFGIFLLLINMFVNYFLQDAGVTHEETGAGSQDQNDHVATDTDPAHYNDCSVLATFAGILMTNISTAGSYEPSFHTDTGDNDDRFIVTSSTFDNNEGLCTMESKEDNNITDTRTDNMKEGSTPVCDTETDSHNEPTALETTQFPEIVDVPETEFVEEEVIDTVGEDQLSMSSDEKEEEAERPAPVVPYSKFRSMKKTNIKATDTMREAARKILMFHFGEMVEHERGTKVGRDIEELHDMRVAAMRMRSAVEVLEDHLDMDEMSSHYKNIKSIRKTLGSVRDLDVFLEKIDHYLADQSSEDSPELDPLTDSILIERAKNRGNMLVYLDDPKYNKFKKNFASYLGHKKSWKMRKIKKNGDPVPCRVMDVLPVLLYTQFATVRAYDVVVSDDAVVDPSLDRYHQLRIDVKILRYTLEFFKEVLGSESKSLIKDLKGLQDNLGDMHDTVVALELLENFEKYGKWGDKDGSGSASEGSRDYPGVDAYIEFRKQELQDLLDAFPEAWSKVIDPEFSVTFSKAISGIYTS